MSNFFLRSMSVGIPSTGAKRERLNSGKVSAGGVTYGFADTTDDVAPKGPPSAYCKSCKINVQGIGLLKRCEVELKAYTKD